MKTKYTEYQNPLNTRYASEKMSFIFSPQFKFQTWRKLWITLAKSEQELGLPITDEQIEELKKFELDINFEVASENEKRTRHDVMSHVQAYGEQCPKASPIIHLGATSCFVGDNTDLIQIKEALKLTRSRLLLLMDRLSQFALEYKDLPVLGFTHYQPAQLTTVGKRCCLWIQEILLDFQELEFLLAKLPFRGIKGTTGTQASFLELFNGDEEKVSLLDQKITDKMGFNKKLTITGQTYTRKVDSQIMHCLSNISQSLSKFSTDIRLLQNLKEIEEPFEKSQIGSSAMAYKRNPMRSERIGSLARFVQSFVHSTAFTASTQWFERTLDDSANKRLSIPQGFLAIDAMLILACNISENFVVYPKVIHRRVMNELPFMATENILMVCVKNGGNRQDLHEVIRVHSQEVAKQIKQEGKENDLIERLIADDAITMSKEEIIGILDPKKFTGRAASLTTEFIVNEIKPVLEQYSDYKDITNEELKV